MRRIIGTAAVIALGLVLASCDDGDQTATFLGTWTEVARDPGSHVSAFVQTEELPSNGFGLTLGRGGYALIRTSAYAGLDFPSPVLYEGTWDEVAANRLAVKYGNYQGDYVIDVEILEMTSRDMTAVVVRSGPF